MMISFHSEIYIYCCCNEVVKALWERDQLVTLTYCGEMRVRSSGVVEALVPGVADL